MKCISKSPKVGLYPVTSSYYSSNRTVWLLTLKVTEDV